MRLRECLTEITRSLRAVLPAKMSDHSEIAQILFLQGHIPAAEVCVLGGERITDKGHTRDWRFAASRPDVGEWQQLHVVLSSK